MHDSIELESFRDLLNSPRRIRIIKFIWCLFPNDKILKSGFNGFFGASEVDYGAVV